jgi:ribonuclease HI
MINFSRADVLIEIMKKWGLNPTERGTSLVCRWFQDKKGTGAGVYCYGTRRKLSFNLGQYITVCQAEVYAIMACAIENIDRSCENRKVYILSNSQARNKTLGKHQITSKPVWNCQQSSIQLAKHNRVQLIWAPVHEGIVGNETADQLTRTGSEYPFIGLEPACVISTGVAKKAIREWMNRTHKKEHWESTTGLIQATGLIPGPSARRMKDLLKLNRDQLRWVIGLFTGHCHLKGLTGTDRRPHL